MATQEEPQTELRARIPDSVHAKLIGRFPQYGGPAWVVRFLVTRFMEELDQQPEHLAIFQKLYEDEVRKEKEAHVS